MDDKPSTTDPAGCDFCRDQPSLLHIHARCHLTAPLSATLEGNVVTLRRYLPGCNRMVARFRFVEMQPEKG